MAAVILASLVVAVPAQAADTNIDKVVVSRSFDGVITFWLDFAESVTLDDDTTVQVAIDSDQDPQSGVDGVDYSLDWTGQASLLSVVADETVQSRPESLEFEHDGDVVTLSIAAEDVGSPDRFDFYTLVEQQHAGTAPDHVLFSPMWTYPTNGVAPGEQYPAETYDDLADGSLPEGSLLELGLALGGLLAVGGLVAGTGWSVERYRRRQRRPAV